MDGDHLPEGSVSPSGRCCAHGAVCTRLHPWSASSFRACSSSRCWTRTIRRRRKTCVPCRSIRPVCLRGGEHRARDGGVCQAKARERAARGRGNLMAYWIGDRGDGLPFVATGAASSGICVDGPWKCCTTSVLRAGILCSSGRPDITPTSRTHLVGRRSCGTSRTLPNVTPKR